MRKKRRNGRVTTETSVEDEIVHLRVLDLKGLRARWQSVLQRPASDHLPRHLLFAIIAYRIQVDRSGDLDHETRQLLDRTGMRESGTAMSARLVSFDQKRTGLTPGTVLVRGGDRRSQRVMVMSDGFAWNGQTYDSLSKVAFAITGTNWNGPRFFGLRNKEDRLAMGQARSWIGRPWVRPGHEVPFGQNGPLRYLCPSLHRARARSEVQLTGCPIRCCLGIYKE